VMTLFSRGDDPLSHRVRIVVAVKSLEVRVVEVDPARPPEDLIDLNPYQAVPTLVDRDLVIYGAGIICEYLDERFPAPSLMPVDPGREGAGTPRAAQDRTGLVFARAGARVGRTSRTAASAPRAAGEHVDRGSAVSRATVVPLGPLLAAGCGGGAHPLAAASLEVELPDSAQAAERYSKRVFAHPAFLASLSRAEREMRK